MRYILNLLNTKISNETYGAFSNNLDSDLFFINHKYPLELFQLLRINGLVFEIVGIAVNEKGFEYKIQLCYDMEYYTNVL